jgi:hypothetical protein
MPKDNRRIHSGVRHNGTTYKAGMEDELSEVLSQKQLDRLTERGSISGNWTGLAEDADDDDLTEADDESGQTDDPNEQVEAAPAKKSAAKKSSSKKSSSKKSAK